MTQEQYVKYIQSRLVTLASKKYSHDEHLQLIYQIGFLQAQLAQAMYNDSKVANDFKRALHNGLEN